MNRLIFSEGGQPVFLDDLKMLQDNMVDLVMSLFPITDGEAQNSICDDYNIKDVRNLPVYSTPRHLNGCADTNTETVQAHKLITKNGVYDVPQTTMTEDTDTGASYIRDCYYVLHEEILEKREFEDGVTRPVVKSYTAEIVGHKPSSGTYYAVKDVPSLDSLQVVLASKYNDYLKVK